MRRKHGGAIPAGHIRFSRAQTVIAALLFAIGWVNYIDRQILSVLAPILKEQIGVTSLQYAWAVNWFLLAYALMYTGSGLLLDRLGSRVGLAFFVVSWSIASALHATVAGFASLAVFRFLLGLTEPGGWTGAIKAISERFEAAQRGIAAGVFASGSGVAMLAAPPLVVFLSLRYGWRMAFLIPSTIGLLWVPFWLKATRHPPEVTTAATPTSSLELRDVPRLLRDRRVIGYILARFFGDSSGYFFMFWIPEYLSTMKHFSFAMLGALAWIPFVCNDLAPVAGGYVSGKLIQAGFAPVFSRKVLMSTAPLLVAVGALSVPATRTWTVLATLSVSTIGVGVWAGNLHALPGDAFLPRNLATVYGMAGSAGALGGILFNTLVGHFSMHSNYFAVFLLLLALEPLGILGLWLFLRDAQKEPPEHNVSAERAVRSPRRGTLER